MRYLVKVAYDGTNFKGFQKQASDRTIQETIETILSQILNTETKIYGSGRTDAGVHAMNQTFHFDAKEISDLDKFLYSLNRMAPSDINFKEIKPVSDDFHARYDVKNKVYKYFVNYNRYDLFKRNYSCFYPYDIDFDLLKEALNVFIGKHNFQNFTSKEEDEDNYYRTIYSFELEIIDDHEFSLTISGDGFMRYMVRMIVMNVFEVSSGRLSLESLKLQLNSVDRNITSLKAPASGLFLWDVIY